VNSVVSICGSEYFVATVSGRINDFIIFRLRRSGCKQVCRDLAYKRTELVSVNQSSRLMLVILVFIQTAI